jgi:poly(hydroxyalkanoate) depolymerase family esterase
MPLAPTARAPRILAGVLMAALVTAAGGSAVEAGEFTDGTLGTRDYRLFIPSRPAAGVAVPLIVALHGCWQTPEDFARGTRLNVAAERRGRFVLYPAQGPRHNRVRCWNWFDPANQTSRAGELAEILALVRDVQGRHEITAPRVVVLGLSAGASMAVNLACAAPEVVAGIGAVAGGPYRCAAGIETSLPCMRGHGLDADASAKACLAAAGRRSLALRASLWHGADDPVVTPANLSALATMFARVTGAQAGASEKIDGAARTVYRDAHGPVIEAWLVSGMGHAWSGGDVRATHTYPRGPNATDLILDFLLGS